MRLFLDTNVLVSAIIFPDSHVAEFLAQAIERHTIVISSYVVEELHEVFEAKFRSRVSALEAFLSKFSYELVYIPHNIDLTQFPTVRDKDDIPIIASAILGHCDYLVSGDRDLLEIELERPRIVTPQNFKEIDYNETRSAP